MYSTGRNFKASIATAKIRLNKIIVDKLHQIGGVCVFLHISSPSLSPYILILNIMFINIYKKNKGDFVILTRPKT